MVILGSSRRTLLKNMVSRTQLMKTWCKLDERTKYPRQKCHVGPLKTVHSINLVCLSRNIFLISFEKIVIHIYIRGPPKKILSPLAYKLAEKELF